MIQPVYDGSSFLWEIRDGTLYLKGDGDLVFQKNGEGVWDIPWYYLDFVYVKFEGRITSIPPETFHTSDLIEVDIPDTVRDIGALAFCECKSLKKVKFGRESETVGEYAFADCVCLGTIEGGPKVKSVGYHAFENCSSLKWFPSSPVLETIGENAFRDCSSLSSFTIPDSVTSIESNPFSGCTLLKEFQIENNPLFSLDPNGAVLSKNGTELKAVPGAITGINIGKEIKTIGKEAFSGGRIKNITVPGNVLGLDDSVFRGCRELESADVRFLYGIPGDAFRGCSSLSGIIIDRCVRIGPGAFRGCSSLESIRFPENLEAIEEEAFAECTGLKNVAFGDALESLGMRAFYGCTNLKEIDLPGNLFDIGEESFYGCDSLEKAVLGTYPGNENEFLPENTGIAYREE